MNLAWRPPGWSSDPATPLAVVVAAALAAKAKQKRRETLLDADVLVLRDLELLRQCYCTPRWVWRVAGWLLGVKPGEWSGDPFHNEWSHAREFLEPDAWTLQGRPDYDLDDGFATMRDLPDPTPEPGVDTNAVRRIIAEWQETKRIKDGRDDDPAWPGDGPVLANGPHRKGPRGLTGWVHLAARAGRLRKVAAVVPSDHVSWFVEHGLRCDAEVNLGRMDYDLPPGLPPISGNERCSSLLLWDPETRASGAEVQPCILEVEDDRGRLLRLPLRPGLGLVPEVVKVPSG